MGNKRAVEWMKKARRFSSIISFFPYVRGISLSGSLSKGYIGDDPDIDYFIITKPKRLWLTRTLLVAFKKIFLINSHRYFCINYFIDAENMEIEEKNIFTATEIATLKPIYGGKTKINFYKQNSWVGKYYPNYINHEELENLNGRIKPLTRATEFILNNKFGDWLDGYFMRFTIKHWSKKYSSNFSDEEFDLVFKSEKYVSKHHPRNFQNKVLHEFRERAQRVCEKHNLPIEEVII
ncbi:MAG: hypothetical protein K9G76_11510 [Bacteroidales bacterium]|nr:hypothetical protein [Bacteroidales bacterium]MCF8405016.1 hypothetical protein [Bacteroidales bacterium]